MLNLNLLLRYIYLWIAVVVLTTAALTGFSDKMEITMYDATVLSLRIWQFILGLAIFTAGVALVHAWLDQKRLRFPRWLKLTHLIISPVFSIGAFIYLQVLLDHRFNNPKRYFQMEQLRYWEEANLFIVVFIVVFLLIQLLFLIWLFWSVRKGKTV